MINFFNLFKTSLLTATFFITIFTQSSHAAKPSASEDLLEPVTPPALSTTEPVQSALAPLTGTILAIKPKLPEYQQHHVDDFLWVLTRLTETYYSKLVLNGKIESYRTLSEEMQTTFRNIEGLLPQTMEGAPNHEIANKLIAEIARASLLMELTPRFSDSAIVRLFRNSSFQNSGALSLNIILLVLFTRNIIQHPDNAFLVGVNAVGIATLFAANYLGNSRDYQNSRAFSDSYKQLQTLFHQILEYSTDSPSHFSRICEAALRPVALPEKTL